jgi:hypothetical protein
LPKTDINGWSRLVWRRGRLIGARFVTTTELRGADVRQAS